MDKWSFEVTNKAGGLTRVLTATIPAMKSRVTASARVNDVTESADGNDDKSRLDNSLRRLEDRLERMEMNNEQNEKGMRLIKDIAKNLGDLATKNAGIDTIVIRHETVGDNNNEAVPSTRSTVAVPTRATKLTLSSEQKMPNLLGPATKKVVQIEHAIEEPTDPFPNAYYDVHTDSVRVYHGAVYGNPRGDAWPSSHLAGNHHPSWYQHQHSQYSPYWLPWPMPAPYPYAAPPVAYQFAAPPPPPQGRYVLPPPPPPYPRGRSASTAYYELGNRSRAPSCAIGDSGSRADANRIESRHRCRACQEKNTNTQHTCSGRSHTPGNHGHAAHHNPNLQRTGPSGPEKSCQHQQSGNHSGRAGPPHGRPEPGWPETKSERDERTWAEQGRGTNQAWSGVSSETGSERAEREAREGQRKGGRRWKRPESPRPSWGGRTAAASNRWTNRTASVQW